jgi:hypothetical protein
MVRGDQGGPDVYIIYNHDLDGWAIWVIRTAITGPTHLLPNEAFWMVPGTFDA